MKQNHVLARRWHLVRTADNSFIVGIAKYVASTPANTRSSETRYFADRRYLLPMLLSAPATAWRWLCELIVQDLPRRRAFAGCVG
jgi:hypothetical protein